jgi:hypothetical protein
MDPVKPSHRIDANGRGVDQVNCVLISFLEIETLMPMKEPADKTRMFWTLLTDQVLSYFEHHLTRTLETETSELPDNDPLE